MILDDQPRVWSEKCYAIIRQVKPFAPLSVYEHADPPSDNSGLLRAISEAQKFLTEAHKNIKRNLLPLFLRGVPATIVGSSDQLAAGIQKLVFESAAATAVAATRPTAVGVTSGGFGAASIAFGTSSVAGFAAVSVGGPAGMATATHNGRQSRFAPALSGPLRATSPQTRRQPAMSGSGGVLSAGDNDDSGGGSGDGGDGGSGGALAMGGGGSSGGGGGSGGEGGGGRGGGALAVGGGVGGGGGNSGALAMGGSGGGGVQLRATAGTGDHRLDAQMPDAGTQEMQRMVKALFDKEFAPAFQPRSQPRDQPRGVSVIGDNGCFQSAFQSLASVVYESPLGSQGIKKQLWLLVEEFLGRRQGRPSTNTVDFRPFVDEIQHHLDLNPSTLLLDAYTILDAALSVLVRSSTRRVSPIHHISLSMLIIVSRTTLFL